MTTYRISQLAERTGVPATTLRYYETAGLLQPERTATGYRVYDEGDVDRLALISSAKLLGLPLEGIAELLGTWDTGTCASVRSHLGPMLEARLADAERRVDELSAFTALLRAVRDNLALAAPDGPCGPGCGCLVVEGAGPHGGPVPAAFALRRPPDPETETAYIACTLQPNELQSRIADWREALAPCQLREPVEGGVRLRFALDPSTAARIAELAAAEQACCTFLAFDLRIAAPELQLTVRAPELAHPLLEDLFGATE